MLLVLTAASAAFSLTKASTVATSSPVTVTYGEWPDGGVSFAQRPPCQPEVPIGTYSQSELTAVQRELESELTQRQFVGVGLGASTVALDLAPGQEGLAAQIQRRFGPEVSISVGLTNYCGAPGRSPLCAPLPPPRPLPPGLNLKLKLAHSTIRSGDSGSGTLVVYDAGPGVFNVDPGQPLVAEVVRLATRNVVATISGGLNGTGYGTRLRPGQRFTIPVAFGTARCDGGIGSALAAGRYGVVVYISPGGGSASAPRSANYAPTAPVLVQR
jgi:hypothetical protein